VIPVVTAMVLALAGLFFLWTVFFKSDGAGDKKAPGGAERSREVKKLRSLIEQVEKENPELVAEIRSRLIADTKLKKVKEAASEDIGLVVKHWLADDGKE